MALKFKGQGNENLITSRIYRNTYLYQITSTFDQQA